jgi:hypothetical protein
MLFEGHTLAPHASAGVETKRSSLLVWAGIAYHYVVHVGGCTPREVRVAMTLLLATEE